MNQDERIEQARRVAEVLYEGERVAHRSCGVAVAETFRRPVRIYSTLRRGGLTGEGLCGAIRAGEMVLTELLGSDDPAGAVPEPLQQAIADYRLRCIEQFQTGDDGTYVCNDLLSGFADMAAPGRKVFCTSIASQVAAIVAEVALAHGAEFELQELPEG